MLSEHINKIVRSGGNRGYGFTHLSDGTHICYLRCKASIEYACVLNYTFPCAFEDSSEVIPSVNIINNRNITATIEKVHCGGISILVKKVNNTEDIEEFEVSIIAIGRFKDKNK